MLASLRRASLAFTANSIAPLSNRKPRPIGRAWRRLRYTSRKAYKVDVFGFKGEQL